MKLVTFHTKGTLAWLLSGDKVVDLTLAYESHAAGAGAAEGKGLAGVMVPTLT
jgi:hypothetical protein